MNQLQAQIKEADYYLGNMVRKHGLDSRLPAWKFKITKADRGWCRTKTKIITVPLWSFQRSNEYFEYYLLHEASHAISNSMLHGQRFYDIFILVCPKNIQHFELKYKPRNAAAAGIKKPN